MFKSSIQKSILLLTITALFLFFFTACQIDDGLNSLPTMDKLEATGDEVKTLITDSQNLKIDVSGGVAQSLEGLKAGFALNKYPQIKTITFDAMKAMKAIPKTGLYLVDTNYVPNNIEEMLAEMKIKLHKDGTLLNSEGKLVTLFLKCKSMEVKSKNVYETKAPAPLPPPYSFRFRVYMYWKYVGGFCRDFYTGTKAYTYWPGTSSPKNIYRIRTYASITGHGSDYDNCYICHYLASYVHWDMGCWWPSPGGTHGFNYAKFDNGPIHIYVYWSWHY